MRRCGGCPGPRPLGWGRAECDRLPLPHPPRGGGAGQTPPPDDGTRRRPGSSGRRQGRALDAGEGGGGAEGAGFLGGPAWTALTEWSQRLLGWRARARPLSPRLALTGGGASGPGVMAGELSSHISTLISLCFGETGQRHTCTRCTFLIFWQWENVPSAAQCLCCHNSFSGRGVGDLGLHLLSRAVTQMTPFLGKTREIRDERGNGSHCPTKA